MFSGIVEEMGAVRSLTPGTDGARLMILARAILGDLRPGDSVSVSGTCLTVVAVGEDGFSVDVSDETLRVTTLGACRAGAAVNLERALMMNARLGGHLVTGHVDGTGVLRERVRQGDAALLTFDAPESVLPYCLRKGSLTVDGVSLTVNAVSEPQVSVTVIPHTAAVTTLGTVQPGAAVNMEADLIGKYVERLLHRRTGTSEQPPVVDRDYLRKRGLL